MTHFIRLLVLTAFALLPAAAWAAGETGVIELEQPGGIRHAAFSPDGKLVATASGGEGQYAATVIWERSTGKKLHTLQQHENGGDSIDSVTFSRDGKKLATADDGRRLIIWDVATGNKEQTLEHENDVFYNIDFSPNGKLLLADSTIWGIENGVMLKKFDNVGKKARFSADGKSLLDTKDGRIIDIATGNIVFEEHLQKKLSRDEMKKRYGYDSASFIAFSHDGSRVYESRHNSSAPVFNANTGGLLAIGEEAKKMREHGGDKLFFGKNYEFFADAEVPITIGSYDIQTGNTIYAFHYFASSERGWNSHVKFQFYLFAHNVLGKNMPDPGRLSATNAYFAETTLGELLVLVRFHPYQDKNDYYGATFIKDGKTPCKTIPIETNGEFGSYSNDPTICVSPNGNYLWVDRDKISEVHDLRAGKKIGEIPGKCNSSFGTGGCIFSLDNESFMLRVNDKVQIWTVKSVAAASKKQGEKQQDADKMLRDLL